MKIYKVYFFALMLYLLPPIFFGIFIIGQITTYRTDAAFWALFLVSLLPCGLIGTTLSSIGLIKSFKNKKKFNRDIGLIAVSVGGLFLFGGLFALGLLYVVLY